MAAQPGWSKVVFRSGTDGSDLEAAVDLPADSPWFGGHFPGRPVLPGVAWLVLAAQAARERERCRGRTVAVVGFRFVRFKQLVEGPARLALRISASARGGADELRFDGEADGRDVCRGLVLVRAAGSAAAPEEREEA